MNIIHKKVTKKELEEAFKRGYSYGFKGLHEMLNPYGIGTMDLFISWDNGYKKGVIDGNHKF